MRKINYVVLILLIIAICINSVGFTTAKAANYNGVDLQNDEIEIDGSNKPYVKPRYEDLSDEPYMEIQGVQSFSVDATEDEYESNDSFASATVLTGSGSINDYSFSVDATLHRDEALWGLIKKDIDEDYYRFDVLGNANLCVNLNVPTNLDYDLELYQFANVRYAKKDDIVLLKRSAWLYDNNEEISIEITPGTYYLRVYAYENNYSATQYYTLAGNIQYTATAQSIVDLKYNKGAKAALWISDYDPYGISPLSSFEKVEVGYRQYNLNAENYIPLEYHQNPFNIYLDGDIEQATFYLWDDEWREEIYAFLVELEKGLREQVDENAELKFELEKANDIVGGVSTGLGVILSIISVGEKLQKFINILSVTNTLLPVSVSSLLMFAYPQAYDTTQYYHLAHIHNLIVAFERSLNPNSNEVIRVTSSYSNTSTYDSYIGQTNYYCDFTPKYNYDGYSTTADLIDSCSSQTVFRGHTYAISNADDFELALRKGDQYLQDVNTGGDEELVLDNTTVSAKYVAEGQYHWYHFTAPQNGKYKFYSIGGMDTYAEIFENIVPGQGTEGCFAYNDDTDGTNRNFTIMCKLLEGQTVYLRIRGYNWKSTGTYFPMVVREGDLDETAQEISKTDFGYSREYSRTEEISRIELENGFSFVATRLRCGYVNNQYLTLSAKRKDFDTAYLELDFERAIFRFDFSIGLWSEEENISSRNTYILFQYAADNGKWVDAINFDLDTLSHNKDELDNFTYEFNCRVTKIRFYVHTNQVNYEKNKGRVVLDNLNVTY